MKGISIDSSCWDDLFKVYDKLGIIFKKISSVEIDYKVNIGTDSEEEQLKGDLKKIYEGSEGKTTFHPHCVVIACVDQLAVKITNKKLESYPIIKGGPDKITIPICDPDAKNDKYQLWQKIVDGEGWFVKCDFVEKDSNEIIVIPIEKCTLVQTIDMPTNYCEAVEIDVSHLSAKSGEIRLIINCVDRFRAGLTFLDENIIVVAKQGTWMNIPPKEQACTLIHELGHKIGMVPVSAPNQYTKSGHEGPHCHAGLEKHLDYRGVKGSTCVMFGETNRIKYFCGDCADEVKKADLSIGVFTVQIKK